MMDHLIEGTKNSPKVVLDKENNSFEISGRSMPENSRSFYMPIVNWIKQFEPKEGSTITIEVKYSYVNSSSIIGLLGILREFKRFTDSGCTITVNWHSEKYDDDMVTIGEDVSSLCDLDFHFHEYE